MRAHHICLSFVLFVSLVDADEVTLRDGRAIEGKVVEEGDRVRVEGQFGSVTFSRSEVVKITHGPTRKEEYAQRLSQIADKDADGHYKLAQWCQSVGLAREAQDQIQACLSIDPQHEAANKVLGRVNYKGKWMTPEEAEQAQGFVRLGDRWIPVEEKALLDALSETARLDSELRRRVLDLTITEVRGDVIAREQAEAQLSLVDNAVRARALSEALGYPDPEVRAFCAKGLAILLGKDAVEPLARRYLAESDKEVLHVLSSALHAIPGASAAPIFEQALSDKDVLNRIRAEYALAEFSDQEAAPRLLEMLEATTRAQCGSGVIAEGVEIPRRDGAGPIVPQHDAMAMMEKERSAIVFALTKITGVNMGLDIARWRVIVELIRKKDEQGK